jgi:hypothetical protein
MALPVLAAASKRAPDFDHEDLGVDSRAERLRRPAPIVLLTVPSLTDVGSADACLGFERPRLLHAPRYEAHLGEQRERLATGLPRPRARRQGAYLACWPLSMLLRTIGRQLAARCGDLLQNATSVRIQIEPVGSRGTQVLTSTSGMIFSIRSRLLLEVDSEGKE